MRQLLIILLLTLIPLMGFSQSPGDTLVLHGEIGNHFHFSSTHTIKEANREKLLRQLDDASREIEILDEYYLLLSQGKEIAAKELIRKDSSLSNLNEMGRAMTHFLAKIRDSDFLFSPFIQIRNSDYLIVCTLEQLAEMDGYLNADKEVELICVYQEIFISSSKTEVVRLIGFQALE